MKNLFEVVYRQKNDSLRAEASRLFGEFRFCQIESIIFGKKCLNLILRSENRRERESGSEVTFEVRNRSETARLTQHNF